MDNYKYFENAKENAYMTGTPCQFCGTTENCLDGVFIEGDEDYESVCLNCYDAKKAPSKIPPYVAEKVNNDKTETTAAAGSRYDRNESLSIRFSGGEGHCQK